MSRSLKVLPLLMLYGLGEQIRKNLPEQKEPQSEESKNFYLAKAKAKRERKIKRSLI